jgi:hypothetical protein
MKYGEDGKSLVLTDEDEGLKKLSTAEKTSLLYEETHSRELEYVCCHASHGFQRSLIGCFAVRGAGHPREATFELVKGFERLDIKENRNNQKLTPLR